jgi:hypothetical protein
MEAEAIMVVGLWLGLICKGLGMKHVLMRFVLCLGRFFPKGYFWDKTAAFDLGGNKLTERSSRTYK